MKHLYQGKEWTTRVILHSINFSYTPGRFNALDSLQYQRLTWESILSKFLYISILLRCTENKVYIFQCFQLKTFRSELEIRVNMNWLAVVIVLQTATKLVGSFDLPKPLDNFYEEVVRFYKRLRTEGGNWFYLFNQIVWFFKRLVKDTKYITKFLKISA